MFNYYDCFDGMLVFVDTGRMDLMKRKHDRLHVNVRSRLYT